MRCDDDRMSGPVVRPIPGAMLALTIAFAIASVPVSFGHELLIGTVLYPLNGVAFAVAGALIASRWRRSSIGWLLLGVGVLTAFGEAVEGYGYHAGYPAAVTAEWIATWINFVEIGATAIILTLLPSGRVLSARWRPVLWAGIAATGLLVVSSAFGHSTDSSFRSGRNPYAVDSPVFGVLYVIGQVLFLAALLASIVSLVARFRRSSGVERQQLKWIAYAVTALAVMAPLAIFFYYDSVLVQVAIAPVVTALPAAICIAIMRYRLYDIDVIVNRTVVYGSLTILLGGGYVGVSLALGATLGELHSSWVTAGATLAAALAFGPLRRWIQDAVDRRFRRARYAALGRVDAFLEDLRGGRVVPERLEDLMREVLNRPDLELRYVLPDATTYIDAHGAEMSQDDGGRLQTRVERAGVLLAVVTHVEDLDSIDAAPDQLLMKEVLGRAGLAIEIARLQAEVRHQLAEVTASRARIIAAGYAERRRLERDLHDGAQQRLVSIGLALRHAQHQLGSSPVSDTIENAVDQISVAITDLRELANGVRPALLDQGLSVALHDLASRTSLPVSLRATAERFSAEVEATAYFVACEAVTNAVKHSAAKRIVVNAERQDGHLVVTIGDDGVGGAHTSAGSGLRGLCDRVAAHGGRISLDSPDGRGTTLIAELPCAS
jgi:signal transduction histidine kinase